MVGVLMNLAILSKRTIYLFLALILTACGGGSDGGGSVGVTTATGQFKDANTSGVTFVSGNQTGVTDINGTFTYEVGNTITFSVGGVVLGSTNGQSLITPIDLVPSGSSTSAVVQNIVRFLMMLDADGDPTNGITISAAVQTIAQTWPPINFSTADLATELATIISDAVSADGGSHLLPDAAPAQAHLEQTLLCAYSGVGIGTYTGEININGIWYPDSGSFAVHADSITGAVTAKVKTSYLGIFDLSSLSPITIDQNLGFVTGDSTLGLNLSGQFTSLNNISGTYIAPYMHGTFIGSRVGGSTTASYRFSGSYTGDDQGQITLDVDGSNNVNGIFYSIETGDRYVLTGLVAGTTFTATASFGSLSGTLDTTNGTLSGNWNTSSLSGSFTGSGCRLN